MLATDEIACPLLCAPPVTASLPSEATCLIVSVGPLELEPPEERLRGLPLVRELLLVELLELRPFELLAPLRD